ncbi:MAG: hypothetical protein K0M50_05755 [Prolixibacteraceae bacterium]|nr:hypothetical protein [Prolixibacteraceae bacterium]
MNDSQVSYNIPMGVVNVNKYELNRSPGGWSWGGTYRQMLKSINPREIENFIAPTIKILVLQYQQVWQLPTGLIRPEKRLVTRFCRVSYFLRTRVISVRVTGIIKKGVIILNFQLLRISPVG